VYEGFFVVEPLATKPIAAMAITITIIATTNNEEIPFVIRLLDERFKIFHLFGSGTDYYDTLNSVTAPC
jgi:hypothetical protein